MTRDVKRNREREGERGRGGEDEPQLNQDQTVSQGSAWLLSRTATPCRILSDVRDT